MNPDVPDVQPIPPIEDDLQEIATDIRERIEEAMRVVEQSYPTARYKGIAVIMNVINFDDGNQNREGAEYDSENLGSELLNRNFEVYLLKDSKRLTEEVLRLAIEECKNLPLEVAESFLMAVMSHGDEDYIVTSDNINISIWNGIVQPFNNIHGGVKLTGKPKIFIVNCCRGSADDVGVPIPTCQAAPAPDVAHEVGPFPRDNPGRRMGPNPITLWGHDGENIPSYTDILIWKATAPGHVAFRDTEAGTWFIQNICKVLKYCPNENGHLQPFEIMQLIKVVSEVMKDENFLDTDGKKYKQTPYAETVIFSRRFTL